MLPNGRKNPVPTNFVYLDKPTKGVGRYHDDSYLQAPFVLPLPQNIPRPRLRDVTNWKELQQPHKMVFDAETMKRIAEEERAMRIQQEKQRQKALKAMQISEDRRRRLLGQGIVNIAQDEVNQKIWQSKPLSSLDMAARRILKDPTSDFLAKKTVNAATKASGMNNAPKIFKYTIEELKALRPACN